MAHVLSFQKRLDVLAAIVNGSGVRGASRMTGVHQDTIGRLVHAIGIGCERLHDRLVRGLACQLVDMDEQHSWCSKKQKNLPDGAPDDVGEQWTWAALCRTSKLTIAWTVGKRDQEHADMLVADVRARLVVMPQITTDGLKLYERPIAVHFGPAASYAQAVKVPGADPAEYIRRHVVYGTPNLGIASTSAVERSNGTNRCWNARLHRRTLCFSKRLDRHQSAVALQYVYRNFCWIQRTMRETAAMAAGVTGHVWSLDELMTLALAEPAGEKPPLSPIVVPRPSGSAKELPHGRGWLRVVGAEPGVGEQLDLFLRERLP